MHEERRSERPTMHDYITRAGLYLAKRGWRKYGQDHQGFYENFFTEKHVHQASYDLRYQMRREAVSQVLADVLRKPGRLVVLDVGCGVADIIGTLPPCACRIAVPYSEADLRLARLGGNTDVAMVRAAAETLPFADGSVDVVICLEVIEHLPNDRLALRELSRILRRGGLLILSAPAHYYFVDYLELIGHYRHYKRSQLVRLLNEVHLRVVRYIDRQSHIDRLHYYPYMMLQGIHQVLCRSGLQNDSMYARPLIGSIYSRLSRMLRRLERDRTQNALGRDESSTFVAAEKTI
jgi:ubiquinone/menaquinone biosynthesis C-methylase UbiE